MASRRFLKRLGKRAQRRRLARATRKRRVHSNLLRFFARIVASRRSRRMAGFTVRAFRKLGGSVGWLLGTVSKHRVSTQTHAFRLMGKGMGVNQATIDRSVNEEFARLKERRKKFRDRGSKIGRLVGKGVALVITTVDFLAKVASATIVSALSRRRSAERLRSVLYSVVPRLNKRLLLNPRGALRASKRKWRLVKRIIKGMEKKTNTLDTFLW